MYISISLLFIESKYNNSDITKLDKLSFISPFINIIRFSSSLENTSVTLSPLVVVSCIVGINFLSPNIILYKIIKLILKIVRQNI